MNLSNVTGTSLDAAFRQINGTYAGTIGRLAQLIPEVKNLTTEQLAAGEAVKLINNRFGELSRQLADDNIPQKLKNIKDTWGDLRESIGQAVAPIFNPFLDGINRIITGWNNAIKAAQIHKQLLTTSAWDVKISLNEELFGDEHLPPGRTRQANETAGKKHRREHDATQAESTVYGLGL